MLDSSTLDVVIGLSFLYLVFSLICSAINEMVAWAFDLRARTLRSGLQQLLDGERGAFRDIVLLNSGAALVVAGVVRSLREGVGAAAEAIDNGRAMNVLRQSRAVP